MKKLLLLFTTTFLSMFLFAQDNAPTIGNSGYNYLFNNVGGANYCSEQINVFPKSGVSVSAGGSADAMNVTFDGTQGNDLLSNRFEGTTCGPGNHILDFSELTDKKIRVRLKPSADVRIGIFAASDVEGNFTYADGDGDMNNFKQFLGDEFQEVEFTIPAVTWNDVAIDFSKIIGWGIGVRDYDDVSSAPTSSVTLEIDWIQFGDAVPVSVNTAPTVITTIPTQLKEKDFITYTIDLTTVFEDNETVSQDLIYTVSGNTLMNITIANGVATISAKTGAVGSETITFMATDEGDLTVSTSVVFNITNTVVENTAPTVITTIPTQLKEKDFITYTIDLTTVFEDNETVSQDLIYTVSGNTLMNITIANGVATISAKAGTVGNQLVAFTATDEGDLAVSTSVSFNITNTDGGNTAPIVESAIGDKNKTEDFTSFTIDLKSTFTDKETNDETLVYTVSGNTLVNINIVNGLATVSSKAGVTGSETIIFTATDEGDLSVSDPMALTIVSEGTNTAPTVLKPIPNQNLTQDFITYTIDLTAVFGDNETVSQNLIYTVTGNSNIEVVILGGIATISSTKDWFGTEILSFITTDPEGLNVSSNAVFNVSKAVGIKDFDKLEKEIVRAYDILGKEVSVDTKNQILIYEYNDGSKEKVLIIE